MVGRGISTHYTWAHRDASLSSLSFLHHAPILMGDGDQGVFARDTHSECLCECPSKTKNKGNKNLVVCIDGTSNKFGQKNTNVVELYSHLTKSPTQYTYYNSGIGASANVTDSLWDRGIRHVYSLVDLAFARTFDKNIRRAYRWLLSCYDEGDRIFLFGFSRGAYQVRVLAGMLETVGLLYRGNEDQIPFAYSCYKDRDRMGNKLVDGFKKAFSQTVRVHFVGVWDTVSSVGITRRKSFPLTREVGHICFFRHALALDERRVKFLPEYVRGGAGPPRETTAKEATTDKKHKTNTGTLGAPQSNKLEQSGDIGRKVPAQQPTKVTAKLRVKEVWFPGNHSDIGGGSKLNPNFNAGTPPLRWMVYEAALNGLQVTIDSAWGWNPFEHTSSSSNLERQVIDIKPLPKRWKWVNYMPIRRLTYKGEEELTRWPLMWCDGRTILCHQKIHYSIAFKEYANNLHPRAIPPPNSSWNDFVGVARGHHDLSWVTRHAELWEVDVFDDTMGRDVVGAIEAGKDTDIALYRLKLMTGSVEGCRVLIKHKDKMWGLLEKGHPSVRVSVAHAFEAMMDKDNFHRDWDIEILVTIFQSDHEDAPLRNAVGKLLGLHCSVQSIRHDYTATIKTLLGKPPDIQQNTLEMLHTFANNSSSAKLFNDEIASILKDSLASSNSTLVEKILLVLEPLVKIAEARVYICSAISSFLVQKLFEWPTNMIPGLASAIKHRLSVYMRTPFATNQRGGAASGVYWDSYSFCVSAMNILSELLRDDKLQHEVIGYVKCRWLEHKHSVAANLLMVSLTKYGGLKDPWLSTDIVDFLQQVLEYGEDDAKRVCLRIVSLLAETPMQSPEPEGSDVALLTTRREAENGNPRERMLGSVTVSIIRGLLHAGTDDIKKAALECIFGLNTDEDDLRNKVFDLDMRSSFRDILRQESRDVKYTAINFFFYQTNNGDFREKIFVPEIVTVLQDMLCSSEPGARKLADYLLSELAESDELRGRVFTSETINRLKQLVEDDNFETVSVTLSVFFVIGQYSDNFDEITRSACRDVLRNGSKFDKHAVINSFYIKTNNGDFRNRIYIPKITITLLDMLYSNETDAMQLANNLLSELADSDELRSQVFTSNMISALLQMSLRHPDMHPCREINILCRAELRELVFTSQTLSELQAEKCLPENLQNLLDRIIAVRTA